MFLVIFIIFLGIYTFTSTTMERDRTGRNKSKFYINGNVYTCYSAGSWF